VEFATSDSEVARDATSRSVCGDWYGYVEPTVLPHLVATQLLENTPTTSALAGPLAELWRGCMGLSLVEIENEKKKHGGIDC
jgi:hypothetical protein